MRAAVSAGSADSCEVSETLVRETADTMVSSGMQEVRYEYVVIDDCWMCCRSTFHRHKTEGRRTGPHGLGTLLQRSLVADGRCGKRVIHDHIDSLARRHKHRSALDGLYVANHG